MVSVLNYLLLEQTFVIFKLLVVQLFFKFFLIINFYYLFIFNYFEKKSFCL